MRLPLACLAFAGLSACASLQVTDPFAGTTVPTPVFVYVMTGSDIEPSSVSARLDGTTDVSTQFTIEPGSRALSASLPMSLGAHTLHVEARLWNGLYRTYDPASKDTSFTVAPGGALTLQVAPTLAIQPGMSGALNLTVTRSGAFNGDVSVSVAPPASTGSSSTTIPAAATSGSVSIPIASDALPRDDTVAAWARGSLYSATIGDKQYFSLRVGHKPGAFQRASVRVQAPYQTATGPDGITQVSVGNGVAAVYEARFQRGSVTLGTVIELNPGPSVAGQTSGGAGFCPGPGVGFVLSGVGPGVAGNGDFLLSLRYFPDTGYRTQLDLDAYKASGAPFVAPVVLFSPGCGVVIAIGADRGSTKNHLARVYDFLRQKQICTLSFNDMPASLQASVLPVAAGNQMVTINVDGATSSCAVF